MIDRFVGNYRFLSNFFPAKVEFDSVIYPTVEHAYQAAKTLNHEQRDNIRSCETPGLAKRIGKNVDLRPDWERIKLQVMEDLLRQKFSITSLRILLLATGDTRLIEGNPWGDRFWGVSITDGKGENHLGKLLMKIREELAEELFGGGNKRS